MITITISQAPAERSCHTNAYDRSIKPASHKDTDRCTTKYGDQNGDYSASYHVTEWGRSDRHCKKH